MSRRVWAVLVSVVVFGVLLSVTLMAQEQQAATGPKGEGEQFVELRLTMVRPADPGAPRPEGFEPVELPAVQVLPGRQVAVSWRGQRFGQEQQIEFHCMPQVQDDGTVLLKELEVNAQEYAPAHPVGSGGSSVSTTVAVRPGETMALGGTIVRKSQEGVHPPALSRIWQLTVNWPVEAPK